MKIIGRLLEYFVRFIALSGVFLVVASATWMFGASMYELWTQNPRLGEKIGFSAISTYLYLIVLLIVFWMLYILWLAGCFTKRNKGKDE